MKQDQNQKQILQQIKQQDKNNVEHFGQNNNSIQDSYEQVNQPYNNQNDHNKYESNEAIYPLSMGSIYEKKNKKNTNDTEHQPQNLNQLSHRKTGKIKTNQNQKNQKQNEIQQNNKELIQLPKNQIQYLQQDKLNENQQNKNDSLIYTSIKLPLQDHDLSQQGLKTSQNNTLQNKQESDCQQKEIQSPQNYQYILDSEQKKLLNKEGYNHNDFNEIENNNIDDSNKNRKNSNFQDKHIFLLSNQDKSDILLKNQIIASTLSQNNVKNKSKTKYFQYKTQPNLNIQKNENCFQNLNTQNYTEHDQTNKIIENYNENCINSFGFTNLDRSNLSAEQYSQQKLNSENNFFNRTQNSKYDLNKFQKLAQKRSQTTEIQKLKQKEILNISDQNINKSQNNQDQTQNETIFNETTQKQQAQSQNLFSERNLEIQYLKLMKKIKNEHLQEGDQNYCDNYMQVKQDNINEREKSIFRYLDQSKCLNFLKTFQCQQDVLENQNNNYENTEDENQKQQKQQNQLNHLKQFYEHFQKQNQENRIEIIENLDFETFKSMYNIQMGQILQKKQDFEQEKKRQQQILDNKPLLRQLIYNYIKANEKQVGQFRDTKIQFLNEINQLYDQKYYSPSKREKQTIAKIINQKIQDIPFQVQGKLGENENIHTIKSQKQNLNLQTGNLQNQNKSIQKLIKTQSEGTLKYQKSDKVKFNLENTYSIKLQYQHYEELFAKQLEQNLDKQLNLDKQIKRPQSQTGYKHNRKNISQQDDYEGNQLSRFRIEIEENK
ncbi:hypothetical protein PPERSA_06623 [Pseudocohnilembus persalinus]|uniref:Uncharacterized protein n=1 Tax=Pseudocohnilembus persalinus TaxID=266149 RepID=A0A0V0QS42_PSEPJ|nr:hypothetical protein PPERSA_06623 [Pseudocohnilembus persalinus]|eukprot:KRX04989.1 hypothetical protein PPERSA_06623 [Pseudocohnilembus persalinus]